MTYNHPIIHCVSKNVPPLACYNFDTHEWILIFFGRNGTDKVGNQKTLYYATLSNLCFCTTWKNEEMRKSHFHSLGLCYKHNAPVSCIPERTRRPASADRTACRQFQATGQPLSRTQASDAMMSRLPRYEVKCVQRRWVLPMRVGPFAFRYQGNGATPANINWYHSKGNWLRYNFAADSFYIMKHCSRLFVLYCWNCPKKTKNDKFR